MAKIICESVAWLKDMYKTQKGVPVCRSVARPVALVGRVAQDEKIIIFGKNFFDLRLHSDVEN